MTVVMSVIELSRGSVWKPHPAEAPYTVAYPGEPWPDGGDAWVVFTNTAGNELARIYADTVTVDEIRFLADPTQVDPIPAGANFEVFVETDDGPMKIRYGKVIRREAEYLDAPAQQLRSVALNYFDSFPTLGLRSNWKAIAGRTKVYANQGQPNGVSCDSGLFFAQSAIRWDAPLNSDTVKSRVVLLNKGQGECTVAVCADARMTAGFAVRFDAFQNKIHLGNLFSPTAMTDRVPAISHTVTDLSDYTVTFDELTRTLAVYKGTNLTPLSTWPDTAGLVPTGPGYRYAGFSFNTGAFFSPGIEVAGWQAKDN